MQAETLTWARNVAGQRQCRPLDGAKPMAVFEAMESQGLLPLPQTPFVLARWSTAMVGPDIHIKVGRTLYSVPWKLIGGRVDVRSTATMVQVCHEGELVKTHAALEQGKRTEEAGKFGTDSARSMLRSVGVGSVVIGMAAAAIALASLHWALLPMLLAIALPKGWGAARSARRDYISRLNWVDHRRAIASLLAYLTRPHAAGEIRVHCCTTSPPRHGRGADLPAGAAGVRRLHLRGAARRHSAGVATPGSPCRTAGGGTQGFRSGRTTSGRSRGP